MLLTMESKTAAARKLELLIEKGRNKAGEVVEHVMNHQPTDRLVRGAQFGFEADPNRNAVTMSLPGAGGPVHQRLHRHSIQQMAQTTDLPLKFIDSLQQTSEPWGRELLAHNLSTMFKNRFSKGRYLIRSVNEEVRVSCRIVTAGSIPAPSSKPSPRQSRTRARSLTTDT